MNILLFVTNGLFRVKLACSWMIGITWRILNFFEKMESLYSLRLFKIYLLREYTDVSFAYAMLSYLPDTRLGEQT